MEVQEGLASPFQQKLGFTQMLPVFRVDTSNDFISVSIFARQGPFSQVRSHIEQMKAMFYLLDKCNALTLHLQMIALVYMFSSKL